MWVHEKRYGNLLIKLIQIWHKLQCRHGQEHLYGDLIMTASTNEVARPCPLGGLMCLMKCCPNIRKAVV
jgi:hypothetical protein